jgi:hypothetical protein
MFIADLSSMGCQGGEPSPKCVAVGWLDPDRLFATGPTSPEFRRKLRRLCEFPVRKMRGFHECKICTTGAIRGNGEIHVSGRAGEIFVAPSMISHYVDVHNYRPPESFVVAVESVVDELPTVAEHALSDRIFALADKPTLENRDAFYAFFVLSRVGVRVPAELGSVPPGDYVTTGGNRLPIPAATSADGSVVLVVLADVPQLARREAGSTFVELDAADVIKIAVRQGAGIVVQASLPGRQCWAGIPVQDVCRLHATLGRHCGPVGVSHHERGV